MEQATALRIAELRSKSLIEPLSIEEMKEAIALMRADRVSAASTSAKSRSKKGPAKEIDAEDLLAGLEGLDSGLSDLIAPTSPIQQPVAGFRKL